MYMHIHILIQQNITLQDKPPLASSGTDSDSDIEIPKNIVDDPNGMVVFGDSTNTLLDNNRMRMSNITQQKPKKLVIKNFLTVKTLYETDKSGYKY